MFDATTLAKKILSAVVRTENRFGKNYVIEVLRGNRDKKIIANGHDKLSVFGIVKDFSENQLGQIINHLTGLGYLRKNEGRYPTLSITKKGVEFLKGNELLEIPKPHADIGQKAEKGTLDYNLELFEKLRGLRRDLAEKANVPPFVIFGDASLQEMAYYLPQDKDSFALISGVGAKKLKDLSEPFLRVIINFTKENNLTPIDIPAEPLPVIVKNPPHKNSLATLELVSQKIPLEEIAKRQNYKVGTIVEHLQRLTEAGEKLDLDYLNFPQEKLEVIRSAFEKCGNEKLKSVFEYLNGKYSYDDLRLANVIIKMEKKIN
jgi:ATP-dependent DNA helicase RecQ